MQQDLMNDFTETTEAAMNRMIKENNCDINLISDGYHTFGELYEHRIVLYIALCRVLRFDTEKEHLQIFRTKLHSDGTGFEGWFVLGIVDMITGEQITYHLPNLKWELTAFAETLDKAPDFDGHSSQDVLDRISKL